MIFPVDKYRITQGYKAGHPAIDIAPQVAGNTNTVIKAPEKCTVITVGTGSVEGKYCILQSRSNNKYYYFGHFASLSIKTGEVVSEGQKLGIMGMTGLATGIHTHHEVRSHRNSVVGGANYKTYNPIKYYEDNVWYKEYQKYGHYKEDLAFIFGKVPSGSWLKWSTKYKDWLTRNYLRQVAKTQYKKRVEAEKRNVELLARIKELEATQYEQVNETLYRKVQ